MSKIKSANFFYLRLWILLLKVSEESQSYFSLTLKINKIWDNFKNRQNRISARHDQTVRDMDFLFLPLVIILKKSSGSGH